MLNPSPGGGEGGREGGREGERKEEREGGENGGRQGGSGSKESVDTCTYKEDKESVVGGKRMDNSHSMYSTMADCGG